MRLHLFIFPLLALLGMCLPAAASPVNARTITQLSPTRPEKRAITAAICATVSFSVKIKIVLVSSSVELTSICLCATADGALTAQSLTDLYAALDLKILGINLATYTQADAQAAALAALNAQSTTCTYPSFAVPNSCTSCNYACKTGYQLCNHQCVLNGQPCVSPGLMRRRSLATRSKFICPLDRSPCPASRGTTKVDPVFDLKNVECVDIQRKLESCGGCLTPFRDQPQGQDCSQLPNASDVACVGGRCIVESCDRGFAPNDDATGCVALPSPPPPPPATSSLLVLDPPERISALVGLPKKHRRHAASVLHTFEPGTS